MTEERAHAKLSASGAYRWMQCPGSVPLTEDAPPEPDSPAAEEGTTAHGVLEAVMKKHSGIAGTPEMVRHALAAKKYILERLKENPGAELLVETQVDSSSFTAPGNFGTLDIGVVDLWEKLIVMDYKYGQGHIVNPEGDDGRGNPQLAYYALGLAHQYDYLFSSVELVIIQPRGRHDSGETIRSFTMSMDDLLWHRERFLEAAAEVHKAETFYALGKTKNAGFAKFLKPGSHCHWCKAAAICPEIIRKPLEKLGGKLTPNMVLSLPPLEKIDPKKLGALLEAGERIELYVKKLKEFAYQTLKSGGGVEGYKLVERKAQRKWKLGAAEELKEWLGAEACEEPDVLSPAALEKKFKKNKDIKEFVKQNTEKKSSGSTIAKASDSRKAISRSVVDDFGVIDAEISE